MDLNKPQQLRRLCAAAFLASCSYAVCRMPLLPLLARDLGATPAEVGLIVGASTVAGVALKLPAGAWSDVFGRRPFLLAAGAVFAVMPLTYLGVASLGALAALRFAHGSATAIFGPVAAAGVSDIAPAERRATWLSALATLQRTGQVIAPLIAGVLLSVAGFDAAFAAAAVIALSAPLLLWQWPPSAAPAAPGRWRAVRSGVSAAMRDRVIMRTSLTQAAMLAANGATTAFVPLYAADMLALDPIAIGAVFAVQALTGLATRPFAGRASDRLGREPMIAAGVATAGAAIACVPIASGPVTLAVVLMVSASGVAVATTAASALITDRARHGNLGAAHGVFGTVYDVGDALGPIGAGLLVAAIGYAGMFETAAIIAIGAASFLYPIRPSASPASRTAPR